MKIDDCATMIDSYRITSRYCWELSNLSNTFLEKTIIKYRGLRQQELSCFFSRYLPAYDKLDLNLMMVELHQNVFIKISIPASQKIISPSTFKVDRPQGIKAGVIPSFWTAHLELEHSEFSEQIEELYIQHIK